MKKLLLGLSVVLSCFSAFAQHNFTLNLSSSSLEGKKIYLYVFDNSTSFTPIGVDSSVVKNGRLSLSGRVFQPSNVAQISISGKNNFLGVNFFLDSGKNNVNLELPKVDSKFLKFDSDSRGYHIYNDLNNIFNDDAARYPKPTRVNGYLKIPPDLNEKIFHDQLNRLAYYPNDFASLLYLYRMTKMYKTPQAAKNILVTFAKFNDEVRKSLLGQKLYTEQTDLINNDIASRIGEKVPIFEVKDVNNVSFSNSSLAGQNYVIVFSATWCIPCQLQLPRLKKLYETYKKQGLKVIYFNNDDDVVKWKAHVAKNRLDWINVSERLKPRDSKIEKSFGVFAIPSCFVVNRAGVIVYNSNQTDTGLDHIESFIKKAINNR